MLIKILEGSEGLIAIGTLVSIGILMNLFVSIEICDLNLRILT